MFAATGRISATDIRLRLDPEMIPVPPEAKMDAPVSVSAYGFGISLPRRNYRVDVFRREVRFQVSWIDYEVRFGSSNTKDYIRKDIDFRWARPLRVPKTLTIDVQTSGVLGIHQVRRKIIGYSLSSDSLLKIITFAPPKDTFYFSATGPVPEVCYREVCAIGATLQKNVDSHSWAFTAPQDVALWESDDGLSLLASQYTRKRMHDDPLQATRLSVSPMATELDTPQRTQFLKLLAIQWKTGIDVRVVEPRVVEDVFGSSRAGGGGFGSGFAAEWEWTDTGEPQSAQLYLEADRITFVLAKYREIALQSKPLSEYLQSAKVKFKVADILAVRNRIPDD